MKIIFTFALCFFLSTLSIAQNQIPSTTIQTLDNKSIDIQDICTKDKTVVISLWATWCVPCINELNAVNDIYADMQQDVDFELVAISIDDARTVKSVKPMVNGKNWNFNVYLDTNNDLKRTLGAITVPATYIVKNGQIIKKSSGYTPGYEKELWKYLKKIANDDTSNHKIKKKNLYGSFESNTQYYLDDSELGIKEDGKRLANNSYLNLNYMFLNNFTAGVQLENYYPNALKNYYEGYKKAGLAQYNLNYKTKKIDATIGHYFEQFGNGLILRSFEERTLGLNNALLGARVKYSPSDIMNFTALYGRNRHGFKTAKSDVFGLNTEVNLLQAFDIKSLKGLSLGLSYVGRNQSNDNDDPREKSASIPNLVNAFSLRGNIDLGDLYTNIEYTFRGNDISYKRRRAGLQQIYDGKTYNGNALQINTGYAKKGFAISTTFRRLENMSFFAQRNLMNPSENTYGMLRVNFLPSLARQYNYSLSNLYVYQAQSDLLIDNFLGKAGEIGGVIDMYYTFPKGSYFGGKYGTKINVNYSHWSLLKNTFNEENGSYTSDFFAFGNKLNNNVSLEISKKWSEQWKHKITYLHSNIDKGFTNGSPFGQQMIHYHMLAGTSIYKFMDNKSVKLILEHLWTEQDTKNWMGSTLEFNYNRHFSFYASTMYNYGNPNKKINYYNFGGSYNVGATRLALNYGRQRGGLICTGGVCRYVSPNTGFTLNINTAF